MTIPFPYVEDAWRLHDHDPQLGRHTLHADVLERPVPVVVVKITELLKLIIQIGMNVGKDKHEMKIYTSQDNLMNSQ